MDKCVKNNGIQMCRAIACLMVFFSHCTAFHGGIISGAGSFGVSIFIIISGFLAVMSSSSDKVLFRDYLFKKIKMVYPLHIFMLVMALPFIVWSIVISTDKFSDICTKTISLFLNLLMLQSYVPYRNIYFSWNNVSWYLTLFLTFSVLQKPLKIMMQRFYSRIGGGILVLLVGMDFIWTAIWINHELSHWIIYINPLFRCVDFCSGIVLGYLVLDRESLSGLYGTICFGVISFVVASGTLVFLDKLIAMDSNNIVWGYTALFAPVSIMLVLFFYKIGEDGLLSKNSKNILLKIGDISYEIFMMHFLIIAYMSKVIERFGQLNTFWGVPQTILCFVVTVLAVITWRKFENKFVRIVMN